MTRPAGDDPLEGVPFTIRDVIAVWWSRLWERIGARIDRETDK